MNGETFIDTIKYKGYKIVITADEKGYKVIKTDGNTLINPIYTVDYGENYDYKTLYNQSGVDRLIDISKDDIDKL